MRHRKARHKLSRDTAHRRSLLRNLCREVIEHEQIKTSQAKAKAVKPELEKLITLAKRGDLHARRRALSELGQDKFIVHKLFEEIAPRYAERPGGYTRIENWDPAAPTPPRWCPSSWSSGAGAVERTPTRQGRRLTAVVRLTIAYEGTPFAGWAAQPRRRTVQGEIEAALKRILGESVSR